MRAYARFLLLSILVLLVGIIGRVADDDADLAFVLPLHARHIFVRHAAEHIALMPALNAKAATLSSVSTKQRLGYSAYCPVSPRRSPRYSGWRHNRAGSPLRWRAVRSCICAPACRLPRKCSISSQMKVPVPVAGSRISTSLVDQALAEVLLAQPVRPLDHEFHNFLGV